MLTVLVLGLSLACTEEPAQETAPALEDPTAEGAEGIPAETGEGARIEVSQQEPYGAYLTDAEGRSVYLFLADSTGAVGVTSPRSSTCYDACAEAWPPLLTEGEPVAGEGVDASLLGTVERRDGATQVTYNGWPLYYFAQDQNPGDVQGQDVEGFGAEWYLVSPQGHEVEAGE